MEKRKFYVLRWDFNTDMIEHYDILPYLRAKLEERIEKSKKIENYALQPPKSYNEFISFVEFESMAQFLCRCEYEMIIHGWPVEKRNYKIDIHEQIMMNKNIIAEILYNEYWDNPERLDK